MRWIALILVLSACFGGWWWYRDPARRDKGLRMTTAAVERGDLVQTVTATGRLEPVVNVEVGSQISGLIREILVDFNAPVKAGEVIARIDDATYRANVLSQEANLAQAQAAQALARLQVERSRQLADGGNLAQNQLDQAEVDLARAEANVKVAEAQLLRARIDLERCTILSPVDGVVISRAVDVGQTVAASLNAPTLFTIAADLTRMRILANVSEADIGQVEEGARATFTVDAFPGRVFDGRVEQVRNAPRTVDGVVTYDAVIAVDNAEGRLRPGMTATVSLIVAERAGSLRIPNSALRVRLPEGSYTPAVPLADPAGTGSGEAPATDRTVAAGESRTGRTAEGWRQFAGRQAQGSGSGGPVGAPWRRRGDSARGNERTVYVVASERESSTPRAVLVRTGITDGQFTEVLSGLEEGLLVVTGVDDANLASTAPRPAGGLPFAFR